MQWQLKQTSRAHLTRGICLHTIRGPPVARYGYPMPAHTCNARHTAATSVCTDVRAKRKINHNALRARYEVTGRAYGVFDENTPTTYACNRLFGRHVEIGDGHAQNSAFYGEPRNWVSVRIFTGSAKYSPRRPAPMDRYTHRGVQINRAKLQIRFS